MTSHERCWQQLPILSSLLQHLVYSETNCVFYSLLSQWDWWQRAEVLAIQGAEAESSQASGLPERQSELKVMLGNLVKPCLKTESEDNGEDVVQGLRADLACEPCAQSPV